MKSRRKGNPMTTLTSKPIAVIMPLFAAAIAVVGTVAFPAPVHADGGCIPGDIAGQVPRKASASDMVCVSQTIADLVQQENATAADRREPNGGPYGPLTCKQGWVWREAFDGDGVCVTPQRRQETWQENANAGVGPTGGLTPQTTSTGSAAADPALLSAINDARLHPEKYPPNGNTAGAAMTACPSGFNNSAGLTGTATAHNNFLASMSLTQANKDPHVTPAGGHQWDNGGPIAQAGYNSQRAEIVAIGQGSEAGALQFWMQDDAAFNWAHRNNILNCAITDAGASHLAGGPGGNYWTVDMGTP